MNLSDQESGKGESKSNNSLDINNLMPVTAKKLNKIKTKSI